MYQRTNKLSSIVKQKNASSSDMDMKHSSTNFGILLTKRFFENQMIEDLRRMRNQCLPMKKYLFLVSPPVRHDREDVQ